MTDLSGKLEGQNPKDIAQYFGCKVEIVLAAMMGGAKTYQDIHDFLERRRGN